MDIEAIDFQASPRLLQFVNDKVGEMLHRKDIVTSCKVYLKYDEEAEQGRKMCEVNVHIPGKIVFVKRSAHSFEEAVTEAASAIHEKLEREMHQL